MGAMIMDGGSMASGVGFCTGACVGITVFGTGSVGNFKVELCIKDGPPGPDWVETFCLLNMLNKFL